jgi:Protein of unknown function (DUF1501)
LTQILREAWMKSGSATFQRSVPRRTLLQAGAVGVAGLTWPQLLSAQSLSGQPLSGQSLASEGGERTGFGRAKKCLLLFMWGGPSHIDTFDPKPLAPDNVRGPFQTISTNVPGMNITEHFRRVAGHADKFALVRSLTHDDPAHLSSVHTLLTGHLPPVNKSDAEPPSDRDSPHIGSVLAQMRPAKGAMPSFVTMPWTVSHPAAPGGKAPGQHAGWLGHQFDPFMVEGDPNQANWKVPALTLIDGQSPERLGNRRTLLESLDRQRRSWDGPGAAGQLSQQQTQAFGLLTSATVRGAFDLQQESESTRERYGRNIHGQCVLLAKRLLDHDVPLVSVNWHNDGHNFWDTHGNNFPRLKDQLIPPSDQALAALLEDLAASGQLEDTLIVWVGEFGRAPRINDAAGRDHYPGCYSALLAGGGIQGGQVFGASDSIGAAPASDPVAPHDITATMYHALGISPEAIIHDPVNRPHRVSAGRPIEALFRRV